ncbi:MAG: hypothetical protein JO303_15585 [Caulobacteraceae bacterium]|nr:hypothetical protein [Caulobacteraceae bacterium]
MKVYTLYIEDDRYSVPTLLSAELSGDERAAAFVSEILSRSQHYLAVDAWDDDRHVIRVERG